VSEADMTNNVEILLMVIAVNACILGLAATALFFLNRAVDSLDRGSGRAQIAAPASSHPGAREG